MVVSMSIVEVMDMITPSFIRATRMLSMATKTNGQVEKKTTDAMMNTAITGLMKLFTVATNTTQTITILMTMTTQIDHAIMIEERTIIATEEGIERMIIILNTTSDDDMKRRMIIRALIALGVIQMTIEVQIDMRNMIINIITMM